MRKQATNSSPTREMRAPLADLSGATAKLTLPADLSFEAWHQLGRQLQRITQHIQWWWGDWLNYGESRYGEKYRVAVEKFGLKLQTAKQYAWVAREFETCDRSHVSWTHYKVAASIQDEAERAEILEKAGLEGWSVAKLRQEIKVVSTAAPDPATDRSEPATRIAVASAESAELDDRHPSWDDPRSGNSTQMSRDLEVSSGAKDDEFESCSVWLAPPSNDPEVEQNVVGPEETPAPSVERSCLQVLSSELAPLLTDAAVREANIDLLQQILTRVAEYCADHPGECTPVLKHLRKLIIPRKPAPPTDRQAHSRQQSERPRNREPQPLLAWDRQPESPSVLCGTT